MKRLKTTTLITAISVALLSAQAQTITNLHVFSSLSPGSRTNLDGAAPQGTLLLTGNVLYGTAEEGGTNGRGVIFSVNTDGTGFVVLHAFSATSPQAMTNADGAFPSGGLLLSGNTLYGTTPNGGTNRAGTIFSLNTDDLQFTVLHTFAPMAIDPYQDLGTNADGSGSAATLLLSGGMLYGTAENGGTNGSGTVFALSTDGTIFNVLYTFSENEFNDNADGANPTASLALLNGSLYGAASEGGANGTGTLFTLDTNGDNFTVLHTFGTFNGLNGGTNSDGADPAAGLTVSGNTLYGTTTQAGIAGGGTVFALEIDNTNFTVEHDFTPASDGSYSHGNLFLSGGALFGTTSQGGTNNHGTVFSMTTNGSIFNVSHTFAASGTETNSDGEEPLGGVVLGGNMLYGTTSLGGSNAQGTVFALTLASTITPIPLSIQLISTNVILSWTNPLFSLYSAPSATGTYLQVGNAVSPYTNPASAPEQYFRLQAIQ